MIFPHVDLCKETHFPSLIAVNSAGVLQDRSYITENVHNISRVHYKNILLKKCLICLLNFGEVDGGWMWLRFFLNFTSYLWTLGVCCVLFKDLIDTCVLCIQLRNSSK